MSGKPLKLGILFDGPYIATQAAVLRTVQLRLDEFNAADGVEGRSVEYVVETSDGAHEGLPENLIPSYRKLAGDPEVIAIIGPAISDNCYVTVPEIERAQLPTITWPGSEHSRSEWCFQFQLGSFADETLWLVRALAKLGHRRVGILQAGTVGIGYARHFEREARFNRLVIAGKVYANVHQTDVLAQVSELRSVNPDAIVFLGMGAPTLAMVPAANALGWKVPCFGNIAMLGLARGDAALLREHEGVIWVDQYEPKNRVLQMFEAKYFARHGEKPPALPIATSFWDMTTLVCEGLLRATNLSRAGLKDGLENVKQVPCAVGGENPVMGFCRWDRQAIKGPDLMMYRTVKNGVIESWRG